MSRDYRAPESVAEAVELLSLYFGDAAEMFLETYSGYNWPAGRHGTDDNGNTRRFYGPYSLILSLRPSKYDFSTMDESRLWHERLDATGLLSDVPEAWIDPAEYRLSHV